MHDEHTTQLYDNWASHRLVRTYWVTDTSIMQIAYRRMIMQDPHKFHPIPLVTPINSWSANTLITKHDMW